MATLKQFLQTGELGPIHPGMSEADVRSVLGKPTDESNGKYPHILKYGGLQLSIHKDSDGGTPLLSNIGLYFAPSAEPIPETVRPDDFNGSPETTVVDFHEFFARVGITESAVVESDFANYLVMPSGARITFDQHRLHSIYFSSKRNGPAKKQISVPVPLEVLDQFKILARRWNKSVSELIAEGIPSMKHKTGSFRAQSEDGRNWTLLIYTDFIDAGDSNDPDAIVKGRSELRTSDGRFVNRIEKGKYQVAGAGITLHSDDPVAP